VEGNRDAIRGVVTDMQPDPGIPGAPHLGIPEARHGRQAHRSRLLFAGVVAGVTAGVVAVAVRATTFAGVAGRTPVAAAATVATQIPAMCTPGQLAVDYRGLGYVTGQNVESLAIRDTSASSCTLDGPILLVGLDAAGRDVTSQRTYAVAPQLVLTAHASELGYGAAPPSGVSIGLLPISAQLRDAGGICANLIVPATWAVVLAGAVEYVPNGDGKVPADPDAMSQGALGACGGRLSEPIPPDMVRAYS